MKYLISLKAHSSRHAEKSSPPKDLQEIGEMVDENVYMEEPKEEVTSDRDNKRDRKKNKRAHRPSRKKNKEEKVIV